MNRQSRRVSGSSCCCCCRRRCRAGGRSASPKSGIARPQARARRCFRAGPGQRLHPLLKMRVDDRAWKGGDGQRLRYIKIDSFVKYSRMADITRGGMRPEAGEKVLPGGRYVGRKQQSARGMLNYSGWRWACNIPCTCVSVRLCRRPTQLSAFLSSSYCCCRCSLRPLPPLATPLRIYATATYGKLVQRVSGKVPVIGTPRLVHRYPSVPRLLTASC